MAYNNGDASSGGAIGTAQRTTTASSENPGTFTRASTDDWVAGTVGIEGVSVVVPSVTTGASAPSSITVSGATCNEQVTATGGASVTAWGTYYGLTASYGSHKDNSGTQASPFSWSDALTSLAAGTLYHYQAYGTNSAGTGTGSDAALLTLPGAPTGLTDGGETVSAVAVTWTNAAVGSGTTVYTMIRYRTDAYPTSYTDGSLGVDWTTGTSGTISGLSAATLYYVAAFSKAVNGALTQYSTASVTLLTLTLPAAPTSLSSTLGNAQVAFTWTSASGGAGTTISTQIQYRTDAYPTAYNDGSTGVAWTTGTSGMASSLTNGTLYYFGAFSKAVNGGQTRYSTASAQTTSTPFTVPTVVTGSATSVKGKEATCGGQVTATGGATITAWGTQFGLTTGYGSTFPNSGTHATAFTWTDGLTSLVPNTLYHFRSYATNPAGTSYGGDGTFTTTLWGGIVSFDGASISTLTVILTPPSSESKTAVTTVDGMNANN